MNIYKSLTWRQEKSSNEIWPIAKKYWKSLWSKNYVLYTLYRGQAEMATLIRNTIYS